MATPPASNPTPSAAPAPIAASAHSNPPSSTLTITGDRSGPGRACSAAAAVPAPASPVATSAGRIRLGVGLLIAATVRRRGYRPGTDGYGGVTVTADRLVSGRMADRTVTPTAIHGLLSANCHHGLAIRHSGAVGGSRRGPQRPAGR